jgi:hypothetical protein
MSFKIKVDKGAITLNGVHGFRISPCQLRVFDERGTVQGWVLSHDIFGKMGMVNENRTELLKQFGRAACKNPVRWAQNQFAREETKRSLTQFMNSKLGL